LLTAYGPAGRPVPGAQIDVPATAELLWVVEQHGRLAPDRSAAFRDRFDGVIADMADLLRDCRDPRTGGILPMPDAASVADPAGQAAIAEAVRGLGSAVRMMANYATGDWAARRDELAALLRPGLPREARYDLDIEFDLGGDAEPEDGAAVPPFYADESERTMRTALFHAKQTRQPQNAGDLLALLATLQGDSTGDAELDGDQLLFRAIALVVAATDGGSLRPDGPR
jgi:hypothetical protein